MKPFSTLVSSRFSRWKRAVMVGVIILLSTGVVSEADEAAFARLRERMVANTIENRGIGDPEVLAAMRTVLRHEFVPDERKRQAYEDRPLPIGLGQTISQPYIVAYMTELLEVDDKSRVLEIGTGSGYQAAVLAEIVAEVYSIEIFEELGLMAQERFERLGYDNITANVADGYYGWKDAAPFDGIIVTCAAGHIPPPLIQQIKPGGRMVIPVGGAFQVQQLMLITKDKAGDVTMKSMLPVRFVPLLGEHQE